MIRPRSRRTAASAVLLATLASVTGCPVTAPVSDQTVTVLATWTEGGQEEKRFRQVLASFTAETGIRVNYQGTRAAVEVLRSYVQSGTPPEVAVLATPGQLFDYAREGSLYPLDDVIGQERENYDERWLLPLVETHIYAVPLKANLKSLIWYNPTRLNGEPPQTWDELEAYVAEVGEAGSAPWCMGMGDSPSSGWPGSDLIEDFLLHGSGPETYSEWASGGMSWLSEEVTEAWERWGEIATTSETVYGGAGTVLLTDFGDAGQPMFTDPPGCFLEHQASFIMSFYREYGDEEEGVPVPQPGGDFDFFHFPALSPQSDDSDDRRPYEVSADWAGMFDDTPEARELIRYLATEEAQRIWPSIDGSSAFTVHERVDPIIHADPVSEKIATILSSDAILCFDAADLMPANLRIAYHRAVLEYLANPDQLQLKTLLEWLDEIQLAIGEEEWLDSRVVCGL